MAQPLVTAFLTQFSSNELRQIERACRFWAKVDRSGECWIWMASLHTDGYGQFEQARAHRTSWELTYGPIEDGLHVCHRCNIKKCVRPEHLFLGTRSQNLRHAVETDLNVGHRKLSNDQVDTIRLALADGERRASVALRYAVHIETIHRIARYETHRRGVV